MSPQCEPALTVLSDTIALPLLDPDDARMLAGPVALVAAGETLDPDTSMSVARALQRNASVVEPILATRGVEMPSVAPMMPRKASKAAPVRRPSVRLRADGRIRIDGTDFSMYEVVKSIPGARWSAAVQWRTAESPRGHWHLPASPASAVNALTALAVFNPRVSNGVRALEEQHARNAEARSRFVDGGHVPEDDGADVVSASLWSHQRVALGYATESSALLLAIPMSGGKRLALTTPIATPSGWTTMGELRDGDEVFDERGEVCRVTTAHPVVHDTDAYGVVFSDGEVIVADAEHLWLTYSRSDREKQSYHHRRGTVCPPLGAVRTTKEIAQTLRVGARGLSNHFIPVTAPLQLPEVDLPVAPYTLGYWLGNGSSRTAEVTTGCASSDHDAPDADQVRALIEADGYVPGRDKDPRPHVSTFTVHGLSADLRAAGVFGDKHIPPAYLRASEKQRRALLAGLLDSDGTVCPHGRVQFDSTREALARGFRELALTLGYRASITSKAARLNGRDYGLTWRGEFTTADADLFRLERKACAHARRSAGARNTGDSRNRWRSITAVRPVPSVPMRCITVDSPSRLYLAGRAMIPTHNTITSIAAINRRGCSTVMIFCPNKVRGVWPREVRERSSVAWHIEDGTRPARRGDGRIDLPVAQRLERAERVLWDCDCPAPIHAFVANYDVLGEPSWRRWTPPHKIDAILYDEVHNLKSGPGVQSKAAARLVDYSHFRMGLSGTPMPQTPLDAYGVMRALDPGVFPGTWTEFKERYAIMHENRTTGRQFPDAHRVQNGEELARRFLSITYLPVVDLKLPAVTDTVREVELETKARTAYAQLDNELWADLSAFTRKGERAAGGGVHNRGDTNPGTADELLAAPFDEQSDEAVDGAEITTPNILTRMLRLQQLTGGTLVTDPERDEEGGVIAPGVKVRVSHAKAKMLEQVFDEIGCTKAAANTDDGAEPVIVFCRFRSDLDAVREVAEHGGLTYAEVSGRRSDGLNADSRMTEHADVVGVQIQAGGTGVDLTRARYAVWYSLGYSVSDYDQARSRLVRVNQNRPVVFVHLIATGTADRAVYDAIDDRRALITSVLRSGSIDPAELGFHEPDPGPRHDSPTGAPVSVAVKLPWD